MDVDPIRHEPDPQLADIWERSKRWILQRTVAIFIRKPDGNPIQWGTGVLLQVGSSCVVVSASHVMDVVKEGVEVLLGTMTPEAKGLISVGDGPVIRTTDQDKLDLAIVHVSEAAAARLAEHKEFVQLPQVEIARAAPQGCYYVAGFAIELTRTDHESKTINVGSFTLTTSLVESDHSHAGVTIALSHSKDAITLSDEGSPARTPHLKGISGCGMWRLWAEGDVHNLASWDESWIRLAGIEHRTAREVVIGTIAFHVFEFLARTQPAEITLSNRGAEFRFL